MEYVPMKEREVYGRSWEFVIKAIEGRVRFPGHSIHKSVENAYEFENDYNAEIRAGTIPLAEQRRAIGGPFRTHVSESEYRRMLATENGIFRNLTNM